MNALATPDPDGQWSGCIAIGVYAWSDGQRAVAIGYGALAIGDSAVVIGRFHDE